jgi:hypothetical protein
MHIAVRTFEGQSCTYKVHHDRKAFGLGYLVSETNKETGGTRFIGRGLADVATWKTEAGAVRAVEKLINESNPHA